MLLDKVKLRIQTGAITLGYSDHICEFLFKVTISELSLKHHHHGETVVSLTTMATGSNYLLKLKLFAW